MSEFVLTYFEVNNSKYKLKNVSSHMESLAKKIESQAGKLEGESGFGISTIRREIQNIGRKCMLESEKVLLLHDFLEEVAKKTKEADKNAANILKDFSVRRAENAWDVISDVFTRFSEILLSLVGPALEEIVTGNSVGEWALELFDFTNTIKGENNLLDMIKELVFGKGGDILDSVVEDAGTSSPAKGAITSWLVDWIKDGFENFTDGEGTFLSDIVETIAEGGVGGVLLGAGLVAGGALVSLFSLEGMAAAAVTSASFVAVKWAADLISGWIFQNDLGFVENIGDVICDWIGETGFVY